jgi:hypothetical protein
MLVVEKILCETILQATAVNFATASPASIETSRAFYLRAKGAPAPTTTSLPAIVKESASLLHRGQPLSA